MQWSYVPSECVSLYWQWLLLLDYLIQEGLSSIYQDVLILLVSPLVSLSAVDETILNHNQKNLQEIGTKTFKVVKQEVSSQ
jgi:hypothetical protein